MSSPLKSPLVEDGSQSGAPSFAAKCFYGFRNSSLVSTKENNLTPKKKNVRNTSRMSEECKPKILQDKYLNEKLLDRIAASPVKQAVLSRCTIEEFRKLYRDEIKEIEHEKEFDNRRITRKLSKIVWKQSEETDDDDDFLNRSTSSDGINFKVTNRGFDVDSVSTSSSSIKPESVIPQPTPDFSKPSQSSTSERVDSAHGRDVSGKNQSSTPPSALSERKFFKSKSVGKSVGTSNVLLGKGFNLRFVRQGKDSNSKRKGRKRLSVTPPSKTSMITKKLRQSLGTGEQTTSSSLSNEGNSSVETTPSQPWLSDVTESKKYDGECFGDDDLDLMVVKKDGNKTYEYMSPNRQRLDYSSGNESPYDSIDDCSLADKCKEENISKKITGNVACKSNEQDGTSVAKDCVAATSSEKLFPIFKMTRRVGRSPNLKTSKANNKAVKDDRSQMVIDAGQKNFGATQCTVCGMVYCHADPIDENAHTNFHKRLLEVLKFPGWKKERVVEEVHFDCAKIILILSDDPKSRRKKVEEIYEVMGRELGFPGDMPFSNPYRKIFLYVSVDREIEGCCVAEPITEGNRVIPGDLDANDASGRRPWCCEKIPEPALMGISRLWVSAQKRRNGVATRLMEAVQQWFAYGSFITKDKIAFSDPTPDGRRFAQKFSGTPTFLVYKYK